LKTLIGQHKFVLAPGVFDLIYARIAERLGFDALYVTGYGISASCFGLPDAGLVTYTDMVGRLREIAEATSTPLIADADTGYGGLLNVRHTVRGYESAGANAIQIEDQTTPKKCGHVGGRRVVAIDEMVSKIRVALDSRRSDETLIVARTDARTPLGIDEALRRAEAYAKAGADVIFVESPESEEELRRVGSEVCSPLMVNMVEGGRTPLVGAARLKEMGFDIAIYPTVGLMAVAAATLRAFTYLRDNGGSGGAAVSPSGFGLKEMNELMGFSEIEAFERRYGI
jgi:2-methylisocitrate lyase-like PEP mutase family enzyme